MLEKAFFERLPVKQYVRENLLDNIAPRYEMIFAFVSMMRYSIAEINADIRHMSSSLRRFDALRVNVSVDLEASLILKPAKPAKYGDD